jgi:chemotaxis methyl-accepting protein methylase
MILGEVVAVARRQLESSYGLALEGLSEAQIAAAVFAVGGGADDPGDARWLERVVDRLPIDESWFFRDDSLWAWIRDEAAPELLERGLAAGRAVRVLSLGCSSGQEAFSAAIAFQAVLEGMGIPPSAASSYVSVLGIDSSPARIEAARSGIANAWSVQRARPELLRGRVSPDDRLAGRWRVDPTVRAACRFEVGNLLALTAPGGALAGFDLVFCRNVLIYFRAAEAVRIAADLGRALDPEALLVLTAPEAHLLAASGRVEPIGHLGAGRVLHAAAGAGPFPAVDRPRPRIRPRPTVRPPRPAPTPTPVPRSVDAVSSHLRVAIEHAAAGRSAEALREARAALFHDPRHLFSRLLVGQHLIPYDADRAREVLRDLVAAASRLPPDQEVPSADGLSVGQLAHAARLLLGKPEGR